MLSGACTGLGEVLITGHFKCTDGLTCSIPLPTYTFDSYPEGCPPEPHACKPGTYYRVKKPYHISDADMFKSDYQRHPDSTDADGCEERAISIWSNLQSVKALVGNWRNAAKNGIREVTLSASSGVTHPAPHKKFPGHYIWWIPDGVNPGDLCGDWVKEPL